MKQFNGSEIVRVPKQNHTSKGDQPKWFENGIWYKADYMGYESLSEVIVSAVLLKSDIKDFVVYEPCEIFFDGKKLKGCSSRNFKKNNEAIITLERLHRSYFGIGLAQKLGSINGAKERIKYTVDFVADKTGINEFGKYLSVMLTLDALFLNEDRHTNNIAVIRSETTGEYRLCPYFDNGLSLLSDLNDYPVGSDVFDLIGKVNAKPFDLSFDEQADAAQALYGCELRIELSSHDIDELFNSLDGWYEPQILSRAKAVLCEQRRKYSFLFD